jgi:hypothetical protein
MKAHFRYKALSVVCFLAISACAPIVEEPLIRALPEGVSGKFYSGRYWLRNITNGTVLTDTVFSLVFSKGVVPESGDFFLWDYTASPSINGCGFYKVLGDTIYLNPGLCVVRGFPIPQGAYRYVFTNSTRQISLEQRAGDYELKINATTLL